ncbi:MAG: nitroreductase family protein [Alkalispirochaeta sp.]
MELLPEIMNRRSVRSFAGTPVASEKLDRIIEAGRRAPSAKNRQAWRFIVIRNEDTRQTLEDACYGQTYVGEAPVAIAICTTNIDYKMPNGQLSYPVDIGIASAFMMIQAEHEGLGTCPITTFREEEVKSLLSVPYKMRVVMILLIGEPAGDGEVTDRFSRDRIVGWEHW